MLLHHYFDSVYWINLHRSDERRRNTESWFVKEGIEATRVEALDGNVLKFLLPENEQETPTRLYAGCIASHLQAMAMSKHRGDSQLLILEDDFVPRRNFADEFAKLANHPTLKENAWDMLYLGFIPLTDCGSMWSYQVIPAADSLGLARATRAYAGAYAYALTAEMRDLLLDKMSKQSERYFGVDAYLRNMALYNNVDYFQSHRIYGVRPQLFAQAEGLSTTTELDEPRFSKSIDGRSPFEYNQIHVKV